MKKFIGIFLLYFCPILGAIGQTSEEKALFDTINKYRVSKGLNKLIWDTSVYKMASHHAKYITIINSAPYNKKLLTHTEELDIADFEELNTVNDRGEKYSKARFVKDPYSSFAENCCLLSSGKTVKKDIHNNFFKCWLNSKDGHKEILEDKSSNFGGCSIQYYFMEVTLDSGVIRKIPMAVAVLDLY